MEQARSDSSNEFPDTGPDIKPFSIGNVFSRYQTVYGNSRRGGVYRDSPTVTLGRKALLSRSTESEPPQEIPERRRVPIELPYSDALVLEYVRDNGMEISLGQLREGDVRFADTQTYTPEELPQSLTRIKQAFSDRGIDVLWLQLDDYRGTCRYNLAVSDARHIEAANTALSALLEEAADDDAEDLKELYRLDPKYHSEIQARFLEGLLQTDDKETIRLKDTRKFVSTYYNSQRSPIFYTDIFRDTRDSIIRLLWEEGVEAYWDKQGKSSNSRYALKVDTGKSSVDFYVAALDIISRIFPEEYTDYIKNR